MVYIAFNPSNYKDLLKQILIFYMTTFVFGGTALALIYMMQPYQIITKNGLFLGNYPLKAILLGGVLGTIILIISFKIVKTKISTKDIFYQIEIYFGKNKVKANAMIDTGNMLKEPITNTPVVILEHTLLYEIIPKQILNNIDEILKGDFTNIPEDIKNQYITKLKFIPFSSIGKTNGMLLGLKADRLVITQNENIKELDKIIIAIYNKSLTKKGEYRALVGIDVI